MSNQLTVFNNPEFGSVRTLKIDGEPWFVGRDVAEALGYGDGNVNSKALTNALVDHVDSEDRKQAPYEMFKGYQNGDFKNISHRGMTIINESGLYSLILSSTLATAKKFKRWVTSEVLPTIRKTGAYHAPGYQPKASSLGEVVKMIESTRETMTRQGCTPHEIAVAVKQICDQFGIQLPECFIKPETLTMKDAMNMIDFVYAHPRGRGKHIPTYEEYMEFCAGQKRIGG